MPNCLATRTVLVSAPAAPASRASTATPQAIHKKCDISLFNNASVRTFQRPFQVTGSPNDRSQLAIRERRRQARHGVPAAQAVSFRNAGFSGVLCAARGFGRRKSAIEDLRARLGRKL